MDLGPVLRVQALPSGRLMVWGADGSLSVQSEGAEALVVVAATALDPWAAEDRDAIAFIGPVDETTPLEPGERRAVWVWDAERGTTELVVEDLHAAQPVLVPRRDLLLYVSTANGSADVVRVDLSVSPREVDPEEGEARERVTFLAPRLDGVPAVYGGERAFFDDRFLVFTAAYATDRIVRLDVDTGDLVVLGDGRFPRLNAQSNVMAVVAAETCVETYEVSP
jgi:hypothetical protein